MTIAVTGASGHIGNVVCRVLIERGYQVKALYHSFSKSLDGLPVELIQGDVLNKDDLDRLIEGCEVVIDSAAIISIHGDPEGKIFRTNTEGPRNILEISKKKGVKRLIHVSSVHAVTEFPRSIPFDETRAYKTADSYAYDFSKATAEKLLLAEVNKSPVDIVILRPSSVVGPFDFKPSMLGNAMLDFYRQKIPAIPAGGYDFVDVRDVAQSLVNAINLGDNGQVYIVSGKYYTMLELVRLIAKVTGRKMPQIVLPHWLLKTILPAAALYARMTGIAPSISSESIDALQNGHPDVDHSKATTILGHHSRPLEESLRDFYQWQHANHFLK